MARGGGRRAVQWVALGLAALFLLVAAVGIVGGAFAGSDDDDAAAGTDGSGTSVDHTLAGTTTSPTTIPQDEQVQREIQTCEQKARDAVVTYQPKKDMVVGVPEGVEAVATAGGAPPPTSLPGDEPTEQTEAQLACRVEAELTGLDFDIEPGGPQEKSFLGTDEVTWRWSVRPVESGNGLPLQLTVRGFVDGFQDLARGPDPITVAISVDAKPRSLTRRVGDVFWGFFDSRLWTGIAGIIALLAFLGIRGREPRRHEEAPTAPAPTSASTPPLPRPQGRPPPPPPPRRRRLG